MRVKKYMLMVLALVAVTINACKKEYEEIGLPASKIDAITSKWVLTTFNVTDKGGIVDESMDMTEYYTANSAMPNITLNILGTDTIFTSDTTGVKLNLFAAPNGRWRFDDINFPTKVILMNDAKVQIAEFNLLAPIKSYDNTLKISQSTFCGAKVVYTYDLLLTRVVN